MSLSARAPVRRLWVIPGAGAALLALTGISQCGDTPVSVCGSINPALGYGGPPYGGSWAALHRDGSNSDFADCEVGSGYVADWALRADPHIHAVKPVIGPDRRAWLAVNTYQSRSDDPTFLYGVDIDTGRIAVTLGTSDGLNGSINYGQPLIDLQGNLYFGQELERPTGTPCRYLGQAESAGQLCGEFMSFDTNGTRRWRIATDAEPLSAQWTPDGKVLMQTWRGTSYVIDPDPAIPDEQRVLFAENHFPEAAATLPPEADSLCALSGQGDTCIIANTPAIHPTTGAIYNTVQGFVAGRVDTFIQRWNYDSFTHSVEIDPQWDISAPITGGSASSPVIYFDGSAVFVNDAAQGVYALDAESGQVTAKTTIPYSPGGSIIVAPDMDAAGNVIGAYLIFNGSSSSAGTNFVSLVHYDGQGGPSLKLIRSFDGTDGSGVAWLAGGGSSAGILDVSVMSPGVRFATVAKKSCGGCSGDGEYSLLLIDPRSATLLTATPIENASSASVSLGPDRSLITSHVGEDLMRRFVAVDATGVRTSLPGRP